MPTDFYEREEQQRWCTQCERWEDSCICEELSEFHRERVKTEEDRYWEEDFGKPKDGEQPHE
jgi:hypothetical protein